MPYTDKRNTQHAAANLAAARCVRCVLVLAAKLVAVRIAAT